MSAWRERGFEDTRGRSKLSPEVVEKVYATFVDNSVTSTDGRNGRNMVTIRKQRYFKIYDAFLEHSDIKIEEKRGKKKRTLSKQPTHTNLHYNGDTSQAAQ